MKTCSKCGEAKPDDNFRRGGVCRECVLAANRAYWHAKPVTTAVAESKSCPTCGIEKPASGFWRNARHPTGLASQCKACSQASRRVKLCIDCGDSWGGPRTAEVRCPTCRVSSALKYCAGCSCVLPIARFTVDRGASDGRAARCSRCSVSSTPCVDCGGVNRSRKGDPRCATCREESGLKWCATCSRPLPLSAFGDRQSNCRACHRDRDLKRNYGITLDEYERLLRRQGGGCGVCGTTDPGGRGWNVDHCHSSLEVRGVLCGNCNTAIGKLGDTSEGVMRAVRYLRAAETLTDLSPERVRRVRSA